MTSAKEANTHGIIWLNGPPWKKQFFWKSIEGDRSITVFCIKPFSPETVSLALFKQIFYYLKMYLHFWFMPWRARGLSSKESVIFSEDDELFSNTEIFKWMPSSDWNSSRQAPALVYLGGNPFPQQPCLSERRSGCSNQAAGGKPNHGFGKTDAMSGLYCCCKSLQLRKNKLLSAEMIISWSCAGDSPRADRRTVAPTLRGKTRPSAESPCNTLNTNETKLEAQALY